MYECMQVSSIIKLQVCVALVNAIATLTEIIVNGHRWKFIKRLLIYCCLLCSPHFCKCMVRKLKGSTHVRSFQNWKGALDSWRHGIDMTTLDRAVKVQESASNRNLEESSTVARIFPSMQKQATIYCGVGEASPQTLHAAPPSPPPPKYLQSALKIAEI